MFYNLLISGTPLKNQPPVRNISPFITYRMCFAPSTGIASGFGISGGPESLATVLLEKKNGENHPKATPTSDIAPSEHVNREQVDSASCFSG